MFSLPYVRNLLRFGVISTTAPYLMSYSTFACLMFNAATYLLTYLLGWSTT